ncbi:MAG: mucin desulfatase, partial [Clostridia bacterium]|nr:mucin desulfatase [Clostridia bacterium]
MTIQDICASFEIGGKYVSCKELSTGIINCTYHVQYFRDGEEKHYIVQRINKAVFKNPAKLMENIVNVTNYVRENIKKQNLSTKRFVLRAFVTKEKQQPYYKDECGDYWRVYRYISNSMTYDVCDDLSIIESAGEAFGRFQNCLDGFDATKLYVSIPNFHNSPERYNTLKKIVKKDPYNRVKKVKKELEFVLEHEKLACKLQKCLDEGLIPLRVTH